MTDVSLAHGDERPGNLYRDITPTAILVLAVGALEEVESTFVISKEIGGSTDPRIDHRYRVTAVPKRVELRMGWMTSWSVR